MSPSFDPRPRLYPDAVGRIALYNDEAVLAEAIERCAAAGWATVDLDAEGWADRTRLHADLAAGLDFPDYYGHNLDALDDALGGLAEGRYGFYRDATGGALVLRRFDRLATADPGLASAVVGALLGAIDTSLERGWPLAVLLQSDDRNLQIAPPPAMPVGWNRAERRR